MPAGRPRKEIDADGVRKLAAIGCTQSEVAEYFGCAQSTISTNFRSEFSLGAAQSRISLRRWQFKRAQAGSDTMLIHLGKQYLGQAEKIDQTSTIRPVEFEVIDDGRNSEISGAAGPETVAE